MDHRALFAIDKKWVGKTYEIEHKISLCWVRKLDTEVHQCILMHQCILIFTYFIKIIDLNSNSIFIIEEKEYHARHPIVN